MVSEGTLQRTIATPATSKIVIAVPSGERLESGWRIIGDYMTCDKCGEEFEELSTSGLNNGNKDDGWYCEDCYEEVHEEK